MAEQHEAKASIQVIERTLSLLNVLAGTAEPASLKIRHRTASLNDHRILAVITPASLV